MFVASLVRAFARSPPASPPLCFGRSVVAASLPALPVVCSAHLACPSSFPPPPVRPLIQPFRARAPPPSLVCSHRGPAMPCVRASSRPPCLSTWPACLTGRPAVRSFCLLGWLAPPAGWFARSLRPSCLLACFSPGWFACLLRPSAPSRSPPSFFFLSTRASAPSPLPPPVRGCVASLVAFVLLPPAPHACVRPSVVRAPGCLPPLVCLFSQVARRSLAPPCACCFVHSFRLSLLPPASPPFARSLVRSFARFAASLVRSCVPHLSPCVWLAGWLCLSLRS